MRPTPSRTIRTPRRAGRVLTALLALALLLAVGGAWHSAARAASAASAAAQAARPTAVALVDLERLINGLDEFNTMQNRVQPLVQELQGELTRLEGQINDLAAEMDLLPAGDTTRVALERDRRKQVLIAEQRAAINQQLINLRFGDEIRAIYLKTLDTIEDIAERDGYDLVIVDDRNVRIPQGVDADRAQAFISRKRILYAAGTIDLTDRVMARMNADFSANQP